MNKTVVVIGGGPAGLLAAGRTAEIFRERGYPYQVMLLESNRRTGEKLLISGGGRCNFTNAQEDMLELSRHYGPEGKALISPFTRFSPRHSMDFFERMGVPWKIEAENRVFPADDRSDSIHRALLRYCTKHGVEILTGSRVASLHRAGEGYTVELAAAGPRGGRIEAAAVIAASGGFARPDTGSDGSMFPSLEALGHRINRPDAILVPIEIRNPHLGMLMGYSIQDCGISLMLSEKDGGGLQQLERRRGKVLFTHFGLSGPGILNLSAGAGELERQHRKELSRGSRFIIRLDRFPQRDHGDLDREILEICRNNPRKLLANALDLLLPRKLRPLLPREAANLLTGNCSELSREGRKLLVRSLKEIDLEYRRRMGEDQAVVARGGIPVDEVDFRTMVSRKSPGLYFAGDILDINRPSGGFSLQICWATGWAAAEAAAAFLMK